MSYLLIILYCVCSKSICEVLQINFLKYRKSHVAQYDNSRLYVYCEPHSTMTVIKSQLNSVADCEISVIKESSLDAIKWWRSAFDELLDDQILRF